ncbi:DUF2292 domain-containing protein [Virgibacillus kimchii]
MKKGTEEKEKYEIITNALKDLRFGEINITIHEGKIVQINRIEKQRFSN